MPKTRTAIPNRREARVIVTSEDLLSVYMQYCCQRNSFCTVNYSAIVLNCLGRFLALSPGPDRGCGETSEGKRGPDAFLGKPENCVRFFQLAWAMRARARMFSPSCCATVLSSRAGGEALDVAGEEFQVHCKAPWRSVSLSKRSSMVMASSLLLGGMPYMV